MVVTVLVTEEEAAVVAEMARVAEASSASGRGGRSALRARRWRKRQMAGIYEKAPASVPPGPAPPSHPRAGLHRNP